jgi:1-acyl-sn-glycerol-3-phosphate acyltransferase
MPLPPLPDPPSRAERIAGLSRALPAGAFLFCTLLGANAVQTASFALLPFSRPAARGINRWAAGTWLGWCVTGAEVLHDVRVAVTGDDIPAGESALLVANHQQMPDITFLMAFARARGRLGDLKFFAKAPIRYVPGLGWGMWLLDFPFLERDWARDRASIEATFARILRDRVPVWLVTFPEGTRFAPDKLEASRQYAREHGLEPPSHTLVPRTKGFVAAVTGLRPHLDAIYDVTIGYEHGVPTLWQYMKGFAKRAHLDWRRYPMRSLPEGDDALARWLRDRFREKDARLESFYRNGGFGG